MPEAKSRGRSRWRPSTPMGVLLLLVLANIGLQLVGASMVKYTSSLATSQHLLIAVMLSALLGLGFGRLMIWNSIHKRFPISLAYPANALFFPCVVALAYFYGEPISTHQALGAGVVTVGVLVLMASSTPQQDF